MKVCNECHTFIAGERQFCPLCGAPAQACADAPETPPPGNQYPDLNRRTAQYHFIGRLLVFVSILGCAVSLLVNFLLAPGFMWSLIVVAAVIYCWLTIPRMLKQGSNFGAQATAITILTCILAVALDFIIGYRGWSVDYVLPSLLMAGIVSIGLLMVFNRTNHAQYLLYQIILGVFGFVPLLLYLLGISDSLLLAVITAILALTTLLGLFVFGDRSVRSEFKRRFHV